MRLYKKYVHLVVFLILIMTVSIIPEHNPFINNDLNCVSPSVLHVSGDKGELLTEITEKADTYTEPPQDAYIDRVWKKTPGRNGVKVNIEESYKKMKKEGVFKEELFVYDTVYPEV